VWRKVEPSRKDVVHQCRINLNRPAAPLAAVDGATRKGIDIAMLDGTHSSRRGPCCHGRDAQLDKGSHLPTKTLGFTD